MKQLLNTNKMYPKKSLGQNFICDKNFINKLGEYVNSDPNYSIIEIGPGKGALTDNLVKKEFKKIYLIEKDEILSKNLAEKYAHLKNVKVMNKDALLVDYSFFSKIKNVIIVGNLPFNVSTKMLFNWLEIKNWPPFYEKMILMFQKEVACRVIAKPNNGRYSRISVASQSRCSVKKLLDAPASIFYPQPKVDGVVLEFIPICDYKNVNFSNLQKILRLSFNHRRKKIKTTLKKHRKILKDLNLDDNLRPENLSVDEYCKIAKLI